MKAWVLYGIKDLRFEEVTTPQPQINEVIVKVKAAGICSSDISRIFETGAYHYPVILGHEFSGVTSDGRRVGVFPLIPCHSCDFCNSGDYETCSNYSYIGSRQDGAFADYVAVPEWNLIALPDSVTFEMAALIEPAAVALHAVKRIDLLKAHSVVVVGNGTVGRLIAEWLIFFGIACIEILGRNDEAILKHYDVCIEVVGTIDSLKRSIELTKPNGQLVLVGNPNGDFNIGRILYWQILRKQISITGSWNSSYPSDWQEVLDNIDVLRLDRFVSYIFEFHELGKAVEMIRSKHHRPGKVIITT